MRKIRICELKTSSSRRCKIRKRSGRRVGGFHYDDFDVWMDILTAGMRMERNNIRHASEKNPDGT
jgi:hypothetical protein